MEEPWILAEQEAQRADRQRKCRPVCADCGRRIAEGWAFELDEGEFLDVLRIPFEQAVQMVLDGQILDSKTQIGILKLHALRMQQTK